MAVAGDELEKLVQEHVVAALAEAKKKHKFFVLAHPTMSSVKDALIAQDTAAYEDIKITWEEFESGTPNIFIDGVHRLQERHVLLLINLQRKDVLFDQLSVMYALPRYGCKGLTVLLPYFPFATMERIDREGEIASAATLARLLSATPSTHSGPARFVFYDIHALQERFYFHDSILPVLLSAMPLLLNLLKTRYENEPISVAFPDEGAKKRFGGFFEKAGYPVLFCSKVREGEKRVVRIAEGDATDRHVIIVDDLCNSGGTVLACKDALKDKGATKVSVFVTHGLFPNNSWQKFVGVGFERVFITDSVPETCKALFERSGGESPFEILPLAPSMHAFLQGTPL
jgi:ribose-phosphate pyrophosphokinase